ncbi:cytochrome c [Pelagibius sp. Alg239-R121]|uniref:c-type cytochrome n=1 Tax=Pelagibius sp. Alg239-R121 TaxID=2993448 RepID=UPI0024A772F8|nr:cytochrome c [Pelagibius sp. Alg239-R121]
MAGAAIALGSYAAVTAVTAYAHGGATGIVKERMDAMEVMGKAMKTVGEMFKGQTDYDANAIQAAAGLVSQHAQEIPVLFPDSEASRGSKHSEALPVIWEQKDKFDGFAADMLRESKALSVIARDGEQRAVRLQFAKTAKVCSSCHTAFRKPKD